MTRLYDGTDCFVYPIVFSEDQSLTVTEDGTDFDGTIAAGIYYPLTESFAADVGVESWYTAISDAIVDAVSLQPATIGAGDPSVSGGHPGWGLEISMNYQSIPWEISVDDDLKPYFGMTPNIGAQSLVPTNNTVNSPYSMRGVWRSPVSATRKFADTDLIQSDSGPIARTRAPTRWMQRDRRTFDYRHIPAIHVKRGRHQIPKYCEVGELGEGDGNNALWHLVDQMNKGRDIIILHGMDPVDDEPQGQGWELARIESGETPSLPDLLEPSPRTAEFYDVELRLEILDGTYGQD